MKNLAIFGAGGLGREVACLIKCINRDSRWNFIGFFDDDIEKDKRNEYGAILGGLNELNSYNMPIDIVLAIANPFVKEKIISKITNSNVSYPNLVSPRAFFLDRNNISMGKGNIIFFDCVVSINVRIGDFNTLIGTTVLGHDDKIGNYNTFMTGAKLSGEIHIGNNNLLGAQAFVMQQSHIGSGIVLGANSALFGSADDGYTYLGNPARKLLKK